MRRSAVTTTLLAILSLALPALAVAQQSAPLTPGERVRIWTARRGPQVGTVSALSVDSVTLDRRPGDRVTIPATSVTRLERSRGPGRCGGGRRAQCVVIGTLIGAAVPTVLLVSGGDAIYAVGVLSPLGAIIGAFTGAKVGGEKWEPVAIARRIE